MANSRRKNDGGFEENIMAILDSTGVRESRDLLDDRLSFLEAVRTGALLSELPSPPSWKIFDAIFQIFIGSASLELAMGSYQLLIDLDKRYPRVYMKNQDESSSFSGVASELVVINEAWSPFTLGSDGIYFEGLGTKSSFHVDSLKFSTLIENIAQTVNGTNSQLSMKTIENLLLFQYLVSVLDADFLPRRAIYKETFDWALFKASVLNMLLGSRRLNFKSVAKECMTVISKRCHQPKDISYKELRDATNLTGSAKLAHDTDVAHAFSATELERQTCSAMQSFFTMIMELDVIRKEADLQGLTSRSDGFRNPLLDIIVDELTYNTSYISFLEVFSEPRWKLDIVLQYFTKYCPKTRSTRRTKDLPDYVTFTGILSFFSTATSIKTIAKKISLDIAQLLLAHAFQASLSLLCSHQDQGHNVGFPEKIGSSSESEISSALISAFQNIKKFDGDSEFAPFQKEALLTAASILMRKS